MIGFYMFFDNGAIFNKYCDKSKTKGWKKIILKETLKETDLVGTLYLQRF